MDIDKQIAVLMKEIETLLIMKFHAEIDAMTARARITVEQDRASQK